MPMNSLSRTTAAEAVGNISARILMMIAAAALAMAFAVALGARPAEAGYRSFGGYYGPYYGGRYHYYSNRHYRKRFYGNYSRYPYYPYYRPYAYYPYYARPVAPVIVIPAPRFGFGFSFGY